MNTAMVGVVCLMCFALNLRSWSASDRDDCSSCQTKAGHTSRLSHQMSVEHLGILSSCCGKGCQKLWLLLHSPGEDKLREYKNAVDHSKADSVHDMNYEWACFLFLFIRKFWLFLHYLYIAVEFSDLWCIYKIKNYCDLKSQYWVCEMSAISFLSIWGLMPLPSQSPATYLSTDSVCSQCTHGWVR